MADHAVAAVGTTGAVRGTDTAGERWDLLSPIAMQKVADRLPAFLAALGPVPGLPKVAQAGWFGSKAIQNCYAFLAGSGPLTLADAALGGLFASHLDRRGEFDFSPYDANDSQGTWNDLPSLGLKGYAEAMAEGQVKYSAYNWEKGMGVANLLNHAIRHLYLRTTGDKSEDHLGHACWNLMAALHSLELWPHLNRDLRGPGCVPPVEELKADTIKAGEWKVEEVPGVSWDEAVRFMNGELPDYRVLVAALRRIVAGADSQTAHSGMSWTEARRIAREALGVVEEPTEASPNSGEPYCSAPSGCRSCPDRATCGDLRRQAGLDLAAPPALSIAQVQVPGGASGSLPDVIHLGIDGTFVALDRFGPGLWQGTLPGGSAATRTAKLAGARPIGFSPSSGSFGAHKPGDPSYRMNPGNTRPGVYKVDGPPSPGPKPVEAPKDQEPFGNLLLIYKTIDGRRRVYGISVRTGSTGVPQSWEYDKDGDWYTEPAKAKSEPITEPTGDLSLVKFDMGGNRWVRAREVAAGRIRVPGSWELVRDQSGVGSDVYREPIPGRPARPEPEEPTGASHLIVKLPDGRRAVRMAHVLSGHLTRPASWLPDVPRRMYVEPVAC